MKIPQHLKQKWNRFFSKTIKETEDYLITKDRIGKYIECKHCGAKSYDPEHVRGRECYNCGMKQHANILASKHQGDKAV